MKLVDTINWKTLLMFWILLLPTGHDWSRSWRKDLCTDCFACSLETTGSLMTGLLFHQSPLLNCLNSLMLFWLEKLFTLILTSLHSKKLVILILHLRVCNRLVLFNLSNLFQRFDRWC